MAVNNVPAEVASVVVRRESASTRPLFAGNAASQTTSLPATIVSASTAATVSAFRPSATNERLAGPGDPYVTTRVESKRVGEIQVLQQAGRDATKVSTTLQTADAALKLIEAKLTRMDELAVDAAATDLSNVQRAVLNQEFVDLRAAIDTIAGAAELSGAAVLDGANSFVATSIGSNIQTGDGIQALTFDSRAGDDFVSDGDTIALSFSSATKLFTAINLTTGNSATSEVVISAPATSETDDIVIGEFGLSVQLNDQFSTSTGITSNNSFQVSGSASSLDLNVRIGTGAAARSDEIAVAVARARVATLSQPLQHDNILTAAGAARAVVNVASAQDALAQMRTNVGSGITRVGTAAAGLEIGITNLQSANATLADLASVADAVQGALHDVVAEAATALLNKVDQVSSIRAQVTSLANLEGLNSLKPVASPVQSGTSDDAGVESGTSAPSLTRQVDEPQAPPSEAEK